MNKLMFFSLKVLLAMLTVYIMFCAVVYFKPEWFCFKPSQTRANITKATSEDYKPQEVTYKAADGTELYGWYTEPVSKNYTVVFMHGNSYNIEKFHKKLIPFIKAGYGTFIGEYRGFGGIKGKINEKNLHADASAMVKYLKTLGYENNNLIVYGMSLGSNLALNTIKEEQTEDDHFHALILEVPFDSLYAVVKDKAEPFLPINLLLKDKYDNIELIKQIETPLFMSVAEEDKVVPMKHAENLFEHANNPKIMLVLPKAKHSNLYDYQNYEDMIKWLE